jgi:hypothetical protein
MVFFFFKKKKNLKHVLGSWKKRGAKKNSCNVWFRSLKCKNLPHLWFMGFGFESPLLGKEKKGKVGTFVFCPFGPSMVLYQEA